MYTNVIIKENVKEKTTTEYTNGFVMRYRKKDAGNKVIHLENHSMPNNKVAIVNQYFDKRYGNYELVAYIDEEKVIVIIV